MNKISRFCTHASLLCQNQNKIIRKFHKKKKNYTHACMFMCKLSKVGYTFTNLNI